MRRLVAASSSLCYVSLAISAVCLATSVVGGEESVEGGEESVVGALSSQLQCVEAFVKLRLDVPSRTVSDDAGSPPAMTSALTPEPLHQHRPSTSYPCVLCPILWLLFFWDTTGTIPPITDMHHSLHN